MVAIGQRIGNYRVRRKLGQGGMGAVYEAVQEEIGRRAAIKVLLEDFAKDKGSIQRFFNEARAVNIIHHPSLVGVFESGRLEDGSAFIIMEYLDGELLSGRLKRLGTLSHPVALSLGRQIASALSAAHQKGIVHRDLKPDNIMIVPDPEAVDGERVKIFDFGLAKLRLTSLGPEGGNPTSFQTQSGAVLGTPTHMAPEQCRGASEVDGKADVYSLGVIMFQMLVGHTPFIAKSVGELMSMHLRDKPPHLRKIDKTIPSGVADLVQSMLLKEPTGRPDTLEIVRQLEALGAHRTRRTPVPPTGPEADDSIAFAKTHSPPPTEAPVVSQATGQSINPTSNRQYIVALGVAALLVLGSAGLLLSEVLPSNPENAMQRPTVTWMIDSEPQGAELIRSDNGVLLGRTPWYSSQAPHKGTLRVQARLAGYRDSTIIVNQSEPSNQKISLEREAQPAPAASPPVSLPSAPSVSLPAPPRTSLPAPTPTPPPPPTVVEKVAVPPVPRVEPPRPIHAVVSSSPPGADVLRASDGKLLGKTPYRYEQSPQKGMLKLLLRAPGHISTPLLLKLSEDSQQTVALQKIGPRPRVHTSPSPVARPVVRQDSIPYEK